MIETNAATRVSPFMLVFYMPYMNLCIGHDEHDEHMEGSHAKRWCDEG